MKSLFSILGIHDKQSLILFIKQFVKFGIVGVSNTLISLIVYYSLLYIGVNYIIAQIFGFIISIVNAYYWNNKYVFKGAKSNHIMRFLKTFVSYGSVFLLSLLTLFIMVDILKISEWIAPLINFCITIPLNFLLNKFWSFK